MLKLNVFPGLVMLSATTLYSGAGWSQGISSTVEPDSAESLPDPALVAVNTDKSRISQHAKDATLFATMHMQPAALADDPKGDVVYLCDGDSLYAVNQTTGAATFIGTYFQSEKCTDGSPSMSSAP